MKIQTGLAYTVGSDEPLPRYPNGKIIDGTIVVLDEYPDCSSDGHCDCQRLTHDRATYDMNLKYADGRDNWVYLCERCWELRKENFGPLGWGRAQRIIISYKSTGTKKIKRTEVGYRRN